MISYEKSVNFVLKKLNRRYWNAFSLFLTYFSKPTIGSPMKYNGPYGLSFQEYPKFSEMPDDIKNKFLNFCYPKDIPDRNKEIKCDRQYRPFASVFIVFDNNGDIVGCAIYLIKTNFNKLPIEYSRIMSKNSDTGEHFDIDKDVGFYNENTGIYNSVEIYRLRRAFNINSRMIPSIGNMLFKACVAKSLQDQVEYMYMTCSDKSKKLINMYVNRLAFEDPGFIVTYDGLNEWKAMRRDCVFCDKKLATLSLKHFHLQTYFRKNLKIKSLYRPKISLALEHQIKKPFLWLQHLLERLYKYIELWKPSFVHFL